MTADFCMFSIIVYRRSSKGSWITKVQPEEEIQWLFLLWFPLLITVCPPLIKEILKAADRRIVSTFGSLKMSAGKIQIKTNSSTHLEEVHRLAQDRKRKEEESQPVSIFLSRPPHTRRRPKSKIINSKMVFSWGGL